MHWVSCSILTQRIPFGPFYTYISLVRGVFHGGLIKIVSVLYTYCLIFCYSSILHLFDIAVLAFTLISDTQYGHRQLQQSSPPLFLLAPTRQSSRNTSVCQSSSMHKRKCPDERNKSLCQFSSSFRGYYCYSFKSKQLTGRICQSYSLDWFLFSPVPSGMINWVC